MASRIVRVAAITTLCILTSAGARSFAQTVLSTTTEEHTDPQRSQNRIRVSTSSELTMAPGWGPIIPVSKADSSGNRYVAVPLVETDLERIVPGASLTLPDTLPAGYRILAVHAGAQTVYVTFKSEEEKQRYLADLKRYLVERSLIAKPLARTRGSESTSPIP